MQEVIQVLIDAGVAAPENIRGCSEEEVKELENHCGVRLPQKYREFLLVMGHGAGTFFIGTDIFYGEALFRMRRFAEDLLEENAEPFKLPEDAFVFSMAQGCSFTYSQAFTGDDPPVYLYIEGKGSPKQIASRFSGYMLDRAAVEARLEAEIARKDEIIQKRKQQKNGLA